MILGFLLKTSDSPESPKVFLYANILKRTLPAGCRRYSYTEIRGKERENGKNKRKKNNDKLTPS